MVFIAFGNLSVTVFKPSAPYTPWDLLEWMPLVYFTSNSTVGPAFQALPISQIRLNQSLSKMFTL